MAIKRYKANADNTIVNAYKPNLISRGTGSNAGQADVLETFSIYGRSLESGSGGNATQRSAELARVLIKFPVTNISTDRSNGVVPASGSVSFYLRMYNAQHSKTVPKDYKLLVLPVSQSWEEGAGLDLESYKDTTRDKEGSNWMNASGSSSAGVGTWDTPGGDYVTGASDPNYVQSFTTGLEDLDVDITGLVEKWISGDISNYGVGVHLSSSYEAYFSSSFGVGQPSASVLDNLDGALKSYYTKRFFARGSQYFFKRPVIEARWDSSTKDDRGEFYYSSSLATAADNLNTLYLYNIVRGKLQNIPDVGTSAILLSLYSGSSSPAGPKLVLSDGNTNLTGGHVSTGIYSASVAITAAATPLATLFDVWHDDSTEYFTGSARPSLLKASEIAQRPTYYLNISNLRNRYNSTESARFNLFVRNKYWSPTVYTVANSNIETTTIESASYRVFRVIDGFEAIPYGTGSDLHTVLSHDVSGNYFNLDMGLLESGYSYAFKFAFYDSDVRSWLEQDEVFKFRIEDYEY